jgi:hypothetical protein
MGRNKRSFSLLSFFKYYELHAVHHETGEPLGLYRKRINRLDHFFDWICTRIVFLQRKYEKTMGKIWQDIKT